jgi:hypothetical protein
MTVKCMYCDCSLGSAEYFVVRQAIKPPRAPFRWKKIGACCDSCEAAGKRTNIEFQRS